MHDAGPDDLDPVDVVAGIDDLDRRDNRIGHGDHVGLAALRGGDGQRRRHDSASFVAHVAADGDGVVGLTEIHRRVLATDVAVAQQARPTPVQFVAIGVGITHELTDVTKLTAQIRSPPELLPRRTWLNGTPRSSARSRGKFSTRSPITLRAISVVPPPMLAV